MSVDQVGDISAGSSCSVPRFQTFNVGWCNSAHCLSDSSCLLPVRWERFHISRTGQAGKEMRLEVFHNLGTWQPGRFAIGREGIFRWQGTSQRTYSAISNGSPMSVTRPSMNARMQNGSVNRKAAQIDGNSDARRPGLWIPPRGLSGCRFVWTWNQFRTYGRGWKKLINRPLFSNSNRDDDNPRRRCFMSSLKDSDDD